MSIVRKSVTTTAGGVLIVAGAVMLVTPGPGLVVMGAGLALLAQEYAWADRLLGRFKAWVKRRTRRG